MLSVDNIAQNGVCNIFLLFAIPKVSYCTRELPDVVPRCDSFENANKNVKPDLIELDACGKGDITIEPNRQSKVNKIEIDENPPRWNNVAIIMPDSISPASLSQDFAAGENRVALRARPDRTLYDARGHTTESKIPVHPMRIVANRTQNDIPADLTVNSEDANQALGFSPQF